MKNNRETYTSQAGCHATADIRKGFLSADILRTLLSAALFAVTLLSAHSCESLSEHPVAVHEPISINAGMASDASDGGTESDNATRSMQLVTDGTLEDYGLGLFASYSDREVTYPFSGIADNYISNAKGMKRDGSWVLDPENFWPMLGNLSFFAYAPYNVNASDVQAVIPSPSYTGGLLSIDYTPSSDNVAYQSDFCMSEPLFGRRYTDGPVQLRFRHTLCQVLFAVTYVNNNPAKQEGTGLPAGLSLKIDQLTLSGVVGTNTVTYTMFEPYFSWKELTDSDVPDASYTLYRGGTFSHLCDKVIPRTVSGDADGRNEIVINGEDNPNGRLLLIPQTVNPGGRSDAQLSLSVALLLNAGTSSETLFSELNVTKELPQNTQWLVGGTVIYHLTIDVSDMTSIAIKFEKADEINNWITPYSDSGNIFNGGNRFHID